MNWLVENWSLLVVIGAAVACVIAYVKRFAALPTEEQVKDLKEWMLYAVLHAEKELGGGTGKLKLRTVYDAFVTKFPWLAKTISFERFSVMIDEVLITARQILESNVAIKNYVEDAQW